MDDKKTMTAEEVAEAVEQIRSNMEIAFDHVGKDEVALAWLSRLAAQAARVPGLEEEVNEARTALARYCGQEKPGAVPLTFLVKQTLTNADAVWKEVKSERDAARKEADDLAKVAEQRLAERNATEAEAEALRERVATLEKGIAALRDSNQVAQDGLTQQYQQADTAARTAEARVKELEAYLERERNPRCQRQECGRERDARRSAEARVRELEDAVRVLNAHLDFTSPWEPGDLDVEDPSGINAAMAHLHALISSASHPPPAPAQGNADVARPELNHDGETIAAALLLLHHKGARTIAKHAQDALGRILECHLGPHAVSTILRDLGLTPCTPPASSCARCGHCCPADGPCPQCGSDPMATGDTLCVECDRSDLALQGQPQPASPTPTPGLREAVGQLLAQRAKDDEWSTLNVSDAFRTCLTHLRAAYDATGGEARLGPTPPVGDSDAFLAMLGTPTGDCALTVETESGARYEVGGNWMADLADDAAKYRAAVERIGDGTVFAQTMRAAMGAPYPDALNSWPEMGPKAREQWRMAVYVALRSFFGIILSPEPVVPETLDKARVVEVLRELADAADRESGDGPVTSQIKGAAWGARRIAERLGLTLGTPPSGPGGGEDWPLPPHDRCEMKCMVGKPQECAGPEMAGIRDATSARIAPTPTPEVPPLVESPPDTSSVGAEYSQGFGDGWTKRGARMRMAMSSRNVAMRRLMGAVGRLVSVYSEITGETPAETAASFEPEVPNHSTASNSSPAPSLSPAPESAPDSNSPQTPAVVWEGDGVRVRDMDPIGIVVDNPGKHPLNEVSLILARALAEAKREVSEMRKAYEAVQYAARNVSWAKAGGEVVAMHSERLRDGAEKAAREAAESMRERAKQAILKQLTKEEEDGLSSDDRGYSALMLRRLAGAVGKLPLE